MISSHLFSFEKTGRKSIYTHIFSISRSANPVMLDRIGGSPHRASLLAHLLASRWCRRCRGGGRGPRGPRRGRTPTLGGGGEGGISGISGSKQGLSLRPRKGVSGSKLCGVPGGGGGGFRPAPTHLGSGINERIKIGDKEINDGKR